MLNSKQEDFLSQSGNKITIRILIIRVWVHPVTSLSYTPDGRQCLVTTTSSLLLLDCVSGDSPSWIRSVAHHGFVLMSSEYCFSLLAEGQRWDKLFLNDSYSC